jgi:hypothetical protein
MAILALKGMAVLTLILVCRVDSKGQRFSLHSDSVIMRVHKVIEL